MFTFSRPVFLTYTNSFVVFYLLHSHDDALVGGGQIIFLLQHYVWYPEKDDESQSQGHAAPKKLLYDEIV